MKKVYLLLAAIGLISTSTMAQVEIREFSGGQAVGNDLSGTTWNETVTEEGTVVLTFNVLNTSGSQKVLKVNRIRVPHGAITCVGVQTLIRTSKECVTLPAR